MDGQAARWPWRSRYNPHRRADDPGHEKSQNVSTKEENFAIVVQRISRVREHTIRAKVFLMQRLSTRDRKSTRLNSSHSQISYAVFCLKKKNVNSSCLCHSGIASYSTAC